MKKFKIILFALLVTLCAVQTYAQTDPNPQWAWAKTIPTVGLQKVIYL